VTADFAREPAFGLFMYLSVLVKLPMPTLDLSNLPSNTIMQLNLPIPRIQDLILQCIPGSIIYDEEPQDRHAEWGFRVNHLLPDWEIMEVIRDAASVLSNSAVIGWHVSQESNNDYEFSVGVYEHCPSLLGPAPAHAPVPLLDLAPILHAIANDPAYWMPIYPTLHEPILQSIAEGDEDLALTSAERTLIEQID
jgi:hypothetical protein